MAYREILPRAYEKNVSRHMSWVGGVSVTFWHIRSGPPAMARTQQ